MLSKRPISVLSLWRYLCSLSARRTYGGERAVLQSEMPSSKKWSFLDLDSSSTREDGMEPSNRTQPLLKDFMSIARTRSVEELAPLAMSLIDMGKLEQAEALYMGIEKYHEQEWLKHRNPAIANMLLHRYLQRDTAEDRQKAARWQQRLLSRIHFIPDAMTFAILFDYYLRKGSAEECRLFYEQTSIDGVTLRDVFSIEFLNDEQKNRLLQILKTTMRSSDEPVALGGLWEDLKSPPNAEQIESNATLDLLNLRFNSSPNGSSTLNNSLNISNPTGKDLLANVRSIESKSQGIAFLKESLKTLSQATQLDPYLVQEQLERDCYAATTMRLRRELENFRQSTRATTYTPDFKRIMAEWYGELTKHILHTLCKMDTIQEGGSPSTSATPKRPPVNAGSTLLYGAMLESLEAEKIALICLQELTRVSSIEPTLKGATVLKQASAIGMALEREIFANQLCKKQFLSHTKLSPKYLSRIFHNRALFESTMRKQYAALEHNLEAIRSGWIPRWPSKLRTEIGAFVLSLAVERLQFEDAQGNHQPAFKHTYSWEGCRRTGVIQIHPTLLQLLTSDPSVLFVEPWAMPMVVPPRPWITYNSGGYLTQRNCCVRLKNDPVHLAVIHQADKNGKLDQILLGLDVLGRTPWRINETVLRVALEMWNDGINVATLQRPPQQEFFEFRKRDCFATHEDYVRYVKQAVAVRQEINNSHSTMCDTNYKLEISRQLVGMVFYLPHSVDFRGRAYPIPPHLSHVGSDLARGLMLFAEGRPLGPKGLEWLKIQLANMAGYDKASLEERVAYVDRMLPAILDSARAPLTGQQWWREADEPWQCLAACIELAAALESPNPEQFISHLPCQQDGSCNGLQHYAALGCDVAGATQVNLAPSDRPQDVYSAIARLVSEKIEQDAQHSSNTLAMKLVGKINRKIVKQTVMTNVYGVTRYGAQQQIEDRLKEFAIVPAEDYKAARNYLTEKVFDSLGTLFEKARQIQLWLSNTAYEISRAVPPHIAASLGSSKQGEVSDQDKILRILSPKPCERTNEEEEGEGEEETDQDGKITATGRKSENHRMSLNGEQSTSRSRKKEQSKHISTESDPFLRYPQTSVMWTTPLGFQVVQPYLKSRVTRLRTVLQTINFKCVSHFDPVDASKQASAFPPNFVHSLDATHMFKTALACSKEGLTFASVHDCFWTHAATVDQMNRILRVQFVDLHSQPILEELRQEFIERYKGYKVPVLVETPKKMAADGHQQEDRTVRSQKWRDICIPPVPPKGDFDVGQVLDSVYFFS